VNPKVVKLMVAGAISALAIDYFFKPSLNRTLGIR
jgi:hypothetical protein